MASPALLIKAAAVLGDERGRRAAGWMAAAILSPLLLLTAFFCALGSGVSEHNVSAVELCFHGGTLPESAPEEYRLCIQQVQSALTELDNVVSAINEQTEQEERLDGTQVKAVFYVLYFGAEDPPDAQQFVDCFVTYEERTRTTDEGEESYRVPHLIEDENTVWRNIHTTLNIEITEEQKENANRVYRLIRYGYAEGGTGFEGEDVPFIGADGFCSPIGENWRRVVASEFGNRRDPITGERRGHNGMDLAVPTGTPVRAALPGKVTAAKYDPSYGYYVMLDHGGGLKTLYAHNSKLLVRAGQTVQAGDVVSLSGSTGRSTGPHLHFEVRVNGERTNPRNYLP